jgi:acetoacetyl-CoA synthetase
VLDRFTQIEPKILFAVDGYFYGGKPFDRRNELKAIVDALPTLEHVIYLPYLEPGNDDAGVAGVTYWADIVTGDPPADFEFEEVPFDHPLWIVYSSGTTGLPKAIVHGHGGVTLEMHKVMRLTINLGPGKCMFFYTTSGWIMWNVLVSAMLVGTKIVLYDGNPASPEVDILWRLASKTRATSFGASPTYVAMMEKNDIVPREKYDYSALEGILLSGSPVTPESMKWLYDNVREDLWVTSQSGGTDVASGFVSGSVILPVYAGEIQARALAVDVQAYNDAGESVIDEVGELVVVQPMPSMPIYFWNDEGNARYRESYFETFPGVWRHGDFLLINERGGCFIQGRSDSTLNRYGVRIGTAEIYRVVERMDEVEDSLIVNLDLSGGRFFMPLFVKLVEGAKLDDALQTRIREALRKQCSPRHVPDKIYRIASVPCTLTGKKLEVPVRKILMGVDPATAVSRDAMAEPDAIDYFIAFVREQRDYQLEA